MKNFDELVEIIRKLRGPDGCPWDRIQTLESLKPHLLEETYEVLEAMDKGGSELKGELGDLLLQVLLQSSICEDRGEFSIYDVVETISEKMIRRHPHVFNNLEGIKTPEEVLTNWEKIKKEEIEHKWRKSVLDGIPKGMPALMRAEKIQKKAAKTGFDWNEIDGVVDKVEEELSELKLEMKVDKQISDEKVKNNRVRIEEELGDLFFSLVNLSRRLNINPESCLIKASNKFENRFRYIEKCSNFENSDLETMNKLWNESKNKKNI